MTQKPRKGDFGKLKSKQFSGEPMPPDLPRSRRSVSIDSWSAPDFDSIHFAIESFLLGYVLFYSKPVQSVCLLARTILRYNIFCVTRRFKRHFVHLCRLTTPSMLASHYIFKRERTQTARELASEWQSSEELRKGEGSERSTWVLSFACALCVCNSFLSCVILKDFFKLSLLL